jgi:hypothetical protein
MYIDSEERKWLFINYNISCRNKNTYDMPTEQVHQTYTSKKLTENLPKKIKVMYAVKNYPDRYSTVGYPTAE